APGRVPSLAALLTVVILLSPGLGTSATPSSQVQLDPQGWALLAPWVQRDASARLAQVNLSQLLGPSPAPTPVGAPGGWEAFFAALHEVPTAAERSQIARFQEQRPFLAAEVQALAADVARAQTLRDGAFASLAPADWARLPGLVARLAAGEVDLPREDAQLLARVDVGALAQAAQLLDNAASTAAPRIADAKARDAAWAASLPGALARADLDDPSAIIARVADEPPVEATGNLSA